MRATWKVDHREFDRTLREYRRISKRTPDVIVNTKGFYIARGAVRHSVRASTAAIRAFIRQDSGRIAGMIINKARGKRGQKGLYGDRMTEAIALMLAARLKGRGFLGSGWLPAVKALQPFAERKGGVPRVPTQKGTKGYGKPARGGGWVAKAIICNLTGSRWDTRGEGLRKANRALQRAFDAEVRSMREYIEQHLAKDARRAGIRKL